MFAHTHTHTHAHTHTRSHAHVQVRGYESYMLLAAGVTFGTSMEPLLDLVR